jgi:hypothetical protein
MDSTRNPYPGPRPFQLEEDRIFAGRDHEITELSSLIIAHRVVLLYAQSGAGKTSLLNAGLAPALQEKGVELLPVARVGIPVPQTVALEHVHNVYTFSAIGDMLPDKPDEDQWLRTATLADALTQIPRRKDEVGDPVLWVIAFDQFEELFSKYPQRWQDCKGFFNQVADALQKDNYLRVLFVLREDSLAVFAEFASLLPESARTWYHLERLREPEALLAITQPLEGTQWSFADQVAETLGRDLMAVTVEDPLGEVISVPGEFVEPVQLPVVCYGLFERIPPTSTTITIADLQTFGNPDEALQLFYEKAIDSAVTTAGIDEGELRSWFETYLITPVGTRGLVFQGRETTGGIPNRVVDVLAAQHLIRPEIRSGSRWYELTHDRFIRPIQRSNLEWKSEQWSSSFEARYTAAIRKAVVETDIAESTLRNFLDSLVAPSGTRLARVAEAIPERTLMILLEAGLLRKEMQGPQQIYTPLHDEIAQAIQQANQNWRARNWPGSRSLHLLESRARRWVRDASKKSALLLTRTELRQAEALSCGRRQSQALALPKLCTISSRLVETPNGLAASSS